VSRRDTHAAWLAALIYALALLAALLLAHYLPDPSALLIGSATAMGYVPMSADGDPLGQSLADQAEGAAAAMAAEGAAAGPPIRDGWEDEPIRVPHHWWLYAAAFAAGLFGGGWLPWM
jgi:hypothetical protein